MLGITGLAFGCWYMRIMDLKKVWKCTFLNLLALSWELYQYCYFYWLYFQIIKWDCSSMPYLWLMRWQLFIVIWKIIILIANNLNFSVPAITIYLWLKEPQPKSAVLLLEALPDITYHFNKSFIYHLWKGKSLWYLQKDHFIWVMDIYLACQLSC